MLDNSHNSYRMFPRKMVPPSREDHLEQGLLQPGLQRLLKRWVARNAKQITARWDAVSKDHTMMEMDAPEQTVVADQAPEPTQQAGDKADAVAPVGFSADTNKNRRSDDFYFQRRVSPPTWTLMTERTKLMIRRQVSSPFPCLKI